MARNIRIVIGQAGFVWVADVSQTSEGVFLKDARTLRSWSTGAGGLGSLARKGPSQCVLEDPTDAIIHPLAIVNQYLCDPNMWASVFPDT